MNRKALLQEDGKVDSETLKAIEEAVLEGHNISSDSNWYTGEDSPECFKEITLCRWGHEGKIHELFDELSSGVMRCLFMIPSIAKEFDLPSKPKDQHNLAFDSYWIDILMKLSLRQKHPVLYANTGAFEEWRPLR